MSLKLCLLASGSKGNCTYISDGKTAALIDIGISYRALCNAAQNTGIDLNSVNAVINTHSHSDHCKGMATFLKKHDVPLYSHFEGKKSLVKVAGLDEKRVSVFTKSFTVSSLTVTPFSLSHDAPVCCGYTVEGGGKRVSIATDLGKAEGQVLEFFYGSDISVIESNHDIVMLREGRYPASLKRRILSDYGHLSNESCAEAIYKLIDKGNRNFVLAHLSEENNLPELAFSSINGYLKNRGIEEGKNFTLSVAYQHKPTKVFCL